LPRSFFSIDGNSGGVHVATSLPQIIMGQRCSCIEGEKERRGAFVDACIASDDEECEQYTQLEKLLEQLDLEQQQQPKQKQLREVLDHLHDVNFHDPETCYQIEGKEDTEEKQQRAKPFNKENGDIGNTNSCCDHQHHTSYAAATIIQASWRRHNANRQYNELIELIAWNVSKVIICQSLFRRKLAAARYNNLLRIAKRRELAVIAIQKNYRGFKKHETMFTDYEKEPPSPNDVTVLNDSLGTSPTDMTTTSNATIAESRSIKNVVGSTMVDQTYLPDRTQMKEYIVEKKNSDGSKTITTMTVRTLRERRTLRDGSHVTEDVSTTSSEKKHIPSKEAQLKKWSEPKQMTISTINQRVSDYHRAYLYALDMKLQSTRQNCSMMVSDSSNPFVGNQYDVLRKVERIENRLASSSTNNNMRLSKIIRSSTCSTLDDSTDYTDDGYESLRSE
jgi:hypothetical protein